MSQKEFQFHADEKKVRSSGTEADSLVNSDLEVFYLAQKKLHDQTLSNLKSKLIGREVLYVGSGGWGNRYKKNYRRKLVTIYKVQLHVNGQVDVYLTTNKKCAVALGSVCLKP